jgi:hypothetical protein
MSLGRTGSHGCETTRARSDSNALARGPAEHSADSNSTSTLDQLERRLVRLIAPFTPGFTTWDVIPRLVMISSTAPYSTA